MKISSKKQYADRILTKYKIKDNINIAKNHYQQDFAFI